MTKLLPQGNSRTLKYELLNTEDDADSPKGEASKPSKKVLPPRRGSNTCRDAIGRFFLSHRNPEFANNAELTSRAAFFVVVLSMPFVFPRHLSQDLDYLMDNGMFSQSVVIFFMLNLNKTTGETIMNVVCGLRGTMISIGITWLLYFLFPDGVTENSNENVFYAGVSVGILFVCAMFFLNFESSTTIFAVSSFIHFWMAFLQPGEDNFQCPFTRGFHLVGNVGINNIITVAFGGLLCISVTFFPYPRWSLQNGRFHAQELVHQLPGLWRAAAEFYMQAQPNHYQADKIYRRLHRMSKLTTNLDGEIAHSWYECFGSRRRHRVRRVLSALNKVNMENYERVYSTSFVITAYPEWNAMHGEAVKLIEPAVNNLINETEVLLNVCLESAFDGKLTEVEDTAIRKMIRSVRKADEALRGTFEIARDSLTHGASGSEKIHMSFNMLCVEHMFLLNIGAFSRLAREFATDLVEEKRDPKVFPAVDELPSISSLWDTSVILDMAHLNWALRGVLSIIVGFVIGYTGYTDLVHQFDASVAATVTVLQTKSIGTSVVKNLGRIQGVVLGSFAGQILRSVSASCDPLGVASLTSTIFFYACCTLFVYYGTKEYSSIACLMAAFGCRELMGGGCDEGEIDKVGSYDKICSMVVGVLIITIFDLVIHPGRSSDVACKAMESTLDTVLKAIKVHFDSNELKIHFHREDLANIISEAQDTSVECSREPRFWRTEWREDVYQDCLKSARRIRYILAALEYTLAQGTDDGKVKNEVIVQMLNSSSFGKLTDIVQERIDAVRPLIGIFTHETVDRFHSLNDPSSLMRCAEEVQRVRQNVITKELATDRKIWTGFQNTISSLELDPLCQMCTVLCSVEAILHRLREIQHAILRA